MGSHIMTLPSPVCKDPLDEKCIQHNLDAVPVTQVSGKVQSVIKLEEKTVEVNPFRVKLMAQPSSLAQEHATIMLPLEDLQTKGNHWR